MASPQRENGFTAIAHEILEAVQQYKFTLNEMKVILCVWRFTYGFNRKSHSMSLTFFMNHTGLSRSRINDSLKRLVECEVINKTEQGNAKQSSSYSFNKNYETWRVEKYLTFKVSSVQNGTSEQYVTSVQDGTSTSVHNDTSTSVQDGTQERNIKDNLKKEEEEVNPVVLFESNFGIMTTFQMQSLWKWVDEFNSREIVCLAIKETAITNPRTPYKYLDRILADWFRRKLLTVNDILREKRKHEELLNHSKKSYKQQNKPSLFEQGEESKKRMAEIPDYNPDSAEQLRKEIEEDPDLLY